MLSLVLNIKNIYAITIMYWTVNDEINIGIKTPIWTTEIQTPIP